MKKRIKIILSIFIILFTISIVKKISVIQNDTFFDIAIGDYIKENGIDMMEHWTWHTEYTYIYSHWLYDIAISLIYNYFSFSGIYIFTLIFSCLISLSIFNILIKKGHNVSISFIITLITIYAFTSGLVARTQIITFLLFILEYYVIEELVSTNKKRYIIPLTIIPIIIANIHSSVWLLSLVFYLPYIAEAIIYKFLKITNIYNENSKIIVENHKILLLILTFIITLFTGLLTPLGSVPYTSMIKTVGSIAASYIAEMQPIIVINFAPIVLICAIFIVLAFTKTKYKLVDILYFIGFLVMSLSTVRSIYYLFFTSAFIMANLIENCFNEYGINIKKYEKLFSEKIIIKLFSSILLLALIIHNFSANTSSYYFELSDYPIKCCEYILKNIDIENMKIYNGYNYGSYLEFCGIPAFMDSRAEVFLSEFNDTTILEDVAYAESGETSYEELFEKYDITHILIYNSETLYTYISQDENYVLLCEEDNFVLYERK